MRKRVSRGCAAVLLHDMDFHDTKSVSSVSSVFYRLLGVRTSSYQFVVYATLFSNEKWLLGEHIAAPDFNS